MLSGTSSQRPLTFEQIADLRERNFSCRFTGKIYLSLFFICLCLFLDSLDFSLDFSLRASAIKPESSTISHLLRRSWGEYGVDLALVLFGCFRLVCGSVSGGFGPRPVFFLVLPWKPFDKELRDRWLKSNARLNRGLYRF